MPTITLQVGQCGNQIGQQLWNAFDRQCRSPNNGQSNGYGIGCEHEYFKEGRTGGRTARCLLIDTEPKVVRGILKGDGVGRLHNPNQCFIGQSGRGNNWAYGYNQLAAAAANTHNNDGSQVVRGWDASITDNPGTTIRETCLLENIMEGVRHEAECCDTAPNFLMLHSLGGGSGSGLGSRLLEAVRQEYPLNYIATVSVAPRTAGDAPLQSLNSVMALSFLQAYADVVMLFNNGDALAKASKTNNCVSMSDMNQHIANSVVGCLWPLDANDVAGGNARIRDLTCTVAADPCTKLVETFTTPISTALGPKGLWHDGCKAIAAQQPRYDVRDDNSEVVISSAMLIGRGIAQEHDPSKELTSRESARNSGQDAISHYIQCVGGAPRFACPADAHDAVYLRTSNQKLDLSTRSVNSIDAGLQRRKQALLPSCGPAATAVVNSSAVIGLLNELHESAQALCNAGAYMHWYARFGCSKDAVTEATAVVEDIEHAYRLASGLRDFL